jgi:hypothetical protein
MEYSQLCQRNGTSTIYVARVGFSQTLVEGGSEVPGTGCMRSIALTRAVAKPCLLMLAYLLVWCDGDSWAGSAG